MRKIIFAFGVFIVGVIVGGYLFRDLQPRSILALDRCHQTCYKPQDLAGLLVAAGIINAGAPLPKVVLETDKTIAIESPFSSQTPFHDIIIPKKDIRDPGSLSDEDRPYLDDAFAVMTQLIRDNHLTTYRIVTNGPGYQSVTYLHFHLEAIK